MPRKNPQIEVTATPMPRDATMIPPSLVSHFEAQGQRLSWGSRHETQRTKAWVSYRFPINMSRDFGDSERDGFATLLREHGCDLNADGTVQRADCYLYKQAEEAWKADEQAAEDVLRRHHSNAEREAFIQTLNDKINPSLGRTFIRDSRPSGASWGG